MIGSGFVVLSAADGDAPLCAAVGTVSKTDDWDDGGFELGAAWASAGAIWCDRPYWTGHPDPAWVAERCDAALDAGASFSQIGNEQNLADVEGWEGGPEEYFAFEDAVRAASRYPSKLLAMPPSPSGDWQRWVRSAGDHAAHAYGSNEEMQAIVAWYLANTSGRVVLTEINFGAGREVDVNAWANAELLPFLDWCGTQSRVVVALHFAWKWDQSGTLPTSVDACGTAVETVIRDWRPPMNGGAPVGDVDLSVPERRALAHPANYSTAVRARTIGVVVHSTAGGAATLAEEAAGTVSWFQNPAAGVSAQRVVGPAEVITCVPDDQTSWHARENNADHLGLEFAIPDTPAFASAAWPAFYYVAGGELLARWAIRYAFPLRWVTSQAEPGLIQHKDSEAGRRDGKRDATGAFVPNQLLAAAERWHAHLTGTGPPPRDVAALQDATWGLCDQLQAVASQWQATGWPSTGAGIAAAAEAAKSLVRSSKLEK